VSTIPEPARGAVEVHPVGAARRPGSPLLAVLRIPTMRWLILAGALHNFNMYALGTFLAPLLQRYHHVSTAEAGLISGLVYGLSGGVGILLGGWACDRVVRHRASGRLEVALLALLLFAPSTFLALRVEAGYAWTFAAWLTPACMFSYIFYAGVYPTIQDIVEPTLRGTAMAVYFFAMYLLGAAIGPVATGWASDYFARRAAGGATLTDLDKAIGLRDAMELIPLLGLALVIVLFLASRTVTRDQEQLRAWMAGRAPGLPQKQANG
jgi:MFS family permease